MNVETLRDDVTTIVLDIFVIEKLFVVASDKIFKTKVSSHENFQIYTIEQHKLRWPILSWVYVNSHLSQLVFRISTFYTPQESTHTPYTFYWYIKKFGTR